jgi:DNA topoisomerase VI subunit A
MVLSPNLVDTGSLAVGQIAMVRWVEAFFARQIKPLLITTGGLPAQATVRVNQKTGMDDPR